MHLPAEVMMKRKKRLRGGGETWEAVRARGHLDEVQALRASVPPGCLLGTPELRTCGHEPLLACAQCLPQQDVSVTNVGVGLPGLACLHGAAGAMP
jgi:hypothetical protein